MWKLAPNHKKIFSKQQTVGKMSGHELLSLGNSGFGWDHVLLAQKSNNWYAFLEKTYIQGRASFRTGEYLMLIATTIYFK